MSEAIPISQLPTASALTGSEVFVADQTGITKGVSASQVSTFVATPLNQTITTLETNLAATTGAASIGANDGASGSLFTTVQGLATYQLAQNSAIVTNAVAGAVAGSAANSAAAAASASAAATSASLALAAGSMGNPYPNSAATYVPQGVAAWSLTSGGSGGTNGTNILATFSGGTLTTNPTIRFDIVGGVVTNVRLVSPGLYIGTGTPTMPTVTFPGSAGSPAIVLTAGVLVPLGGTYWAASADSSSLLEFSNTGGSPVAVANPNASQVSIYQQAAVNALLAPFVSNFQIISDPTYLWAITDGSPNQYITLGCLKSTGQLVFPSLPTALAQVLASYFDITDPLYLFKFVATGSDGNDYIALGIKPDGTLDSPSIRTLTTLANQAITTANAAQAAVGAGAKSKVVAAHRAAQINNPVDATPGDAGGGSNTIATISTATYSAATTLTQVIDLASNLGLFRAQGGVLTADNAYGYQMPVVTVRQNGNDGFTPSLHNICAQRLSFMTDALLFDIALFSGNARVIVDGQYVSKTMTPVLSTGGFNRFIVSLTSTTRKLRRIDIETNSDTHFKATSTLRVGANDTVAPIAIPPLRIAVVGDSFTTSTGATYLSDGYAWKLGYFLGGVNCDVRQIAIGGTGYVNDASSSTQQYTFIQHINDLAQATFDLVVFAGGINDAGLSGVQAAALATWQAARALQPNALFCVLGAWSGDAAPSTAILAVENSLIAAFAVWADTNAVFVPVSTEATGPWVNAANATTIQDGWTDTTHPGNYGHDYLGRRVAAALRQQLGV